MEITFLPLILLGAAVLLLAIFFYYVPFLLWISAKVSGVNISLIQLFLMRIRKVPPYIITRAMIEAHKAGIKTLTRDELEAHYLAGGHVEKVVHALVSASKANIDLPFQMATAIDLAGRDVFEAVQMSVNPKVIDTPPVTAVAKDGIQLIAKARVTVRANIKQLVGGAGEETILARALNPAFMTFQIRKRPYVYLKWAQSADGFMDIRREDASVPSVLLSSAETLRRVHRLRSEVAAIMVGTRTALLDNPSLTVRHWAGRSPVRVVLDRTLKLPVGSHLLDGAVPTLVFTAVEVESRPNVEYVQIDFGQEVLSQVLQYLYGQNLNSLMVEGGAELLESFLDAGLWDEAWVETAPVVLGAGVKAPAVPRRWHPGAPPPNETEFGWLRCSGHISALHRPRPDGRP